MQYYFSTRKVLSINFLGIASVFSIRKDVTSHVKMYVGGEEVNQADVWTFLVKNTGNHTIHPSDFISPVLVEFGEDVKILDSYVSGAKPRGLKASVKIVGERKVEISPTVLNPKDVFKVTVLKSGLGYESFDHKNPPIEGQLDGGKIRFLRWGIAYNQFQVCGALMLLMAVSGVISGLLGNDVLGTVFMFLALGPLLYLVLAIWSFVKIDSEESGGYVEKIGEINSPLNHGIKAKSIEEEEAEQVPDDNQSEAVLKEEDRK